MTRPCRPACSRSSADPVEEVLDEAWEQATEDEQAQLNAIEADAEEIVAGYREDLTRLATALEADLAPLQERINDLWQDLQMKSTSLDVELPDRPVPVRDFTAPAQDQLAEGVAAMREALASGQRVAVHCSGGLGRTGTFLACYLVEQGLPADEAIQRVRAVRPGSIETKSQWEAVHTYAARRQASSARSGE